jgi:GDP-L-fucose synthase
MLQLQKQILVTGGSGLVGRAIQNISNHFLDYNFIFINSSSYDLTDINQTKQMFDNYKPQYVIHLAACVGGLFKNMNEKVNMLEKNLMINYNIVKCSHDYGVKKFIGCLSTCIFPDNITYPINETMLHNGPPHNSNSSYAYAKRMLEIHCNAYKEQYGDNFMCIIPTNIYGPYDNFNLFDAHVIPALIHKCYLAKINKEKFIVSGSGKPLRQFIYSDDLAKLIIKVLSSDSDIDNIILSVPESDEISIGSVAQLIANEFDYEHMIEFDTSLSDGQYKKTADNSKMKDLFDIEFISITDGIKKVVKWFIANYDNVRK